MTEPRLIINMTPTQFATMLDIVGDLVLVWPTDDDAFHLAILPKLLFKLTKETE